MADRVSDRGGGSEGMEDEPETGEGEAGPVWDMNDAGLKARADPVEWFCREVDSTLPFAGKGYTIRYSRRSSLCVTKPPRGHLFGTKR